MNARQIKALGEIWGEQYGLLSVSELGVLMSVVRLSDATNLLEVGHYCGLSTCAIVNALWQRGDDWELTTVDAHIADQWVERPADIATFEGNRGRYFQDARVSPLFIRSETIDRIESEFVFYDGDHGEEQLRFTRAVIDSPAVQTFMFDDRDFDFPKLCVEELRASGWADHSPTLTRLPGDKMNEGTQTLGWFTR